MIAQFFKKRPFALCAAVGEGCALALTALLLLPAAWAIGNQWLPESAGGACGLAAAGLGVLAATVLVVRSRGREALATGGTIALAYGILAALACALGGDKCAFGPWLGWLALAVFAGGGIGALTSIRQNTHRRRRR